ncbi:hypothetical protein GCM10009557_35290 [Virgisporangium ochraceum]|uniref:Uncharacterized protein n=1 Tax=Virgisporangium ochraceum TaxID=65505 RepID=A0A8J3ZRL1_9ACTN|nr:hypothetical protein [Virgisporangium ochraceum]GIJ68912.1 hypothetical protein Voc01_038290 [Virgisporangium ochraceum]
MKVAALGLAAAGALALAVNAPIATTVLGLVLFGVLHNVLELRYVAGRFASVLSGRFLVLLVALVSGIVVCRVAALVVGAPARYAEIVIGYAVLAAAAVVARGTIRHVVLAAVAVATVASTMWPAYHFVVLAHLHNLVPLVFLWEWSRQLPTKTAFRAVQIGWVLVVPALVLAGAVDPWTGDLTATAFVDDPARVVAASAPPSTLDSVMGVRFLVVFAFLQTMHYVVWVWFLPRYAPDAAEAFERRVPALTGPRVWALGVGGGALLAVLFAMDYWGGRSVYAAFATYHAYLEFPVLLALLLGSTGGRNTNEAFSANGASAAVRRGRPDRTAA